MTGFLADFEISSEAGVLDNINVFYGLGVRCMGLTYNSRNFIGDGAGERVDGGLSNFGYAVVDRMNQLGMIINLSHASNKTALEAIEASNNPCALTHTVAGLSWYHKTRTDELLKALAEKGGVIGLETIPNAMIDRRKTVDQRKRQGIWDLLDHIEYAIDLMGINHVCIGTDIGYNRGNDKENRSARARRTNVPPDGRVWLGEPLGWEIPAIARQKPWSKTDPDWPYAEYFEGIYDPSEWPNITRGLVSRGYSDEEIRKIIGLNALKLIETVVG